LNKKELITALEGASGQSKTACEAVIDALPGVLLDAIKNGDSATLPGFVKVDAKKRDAREVRNPATGATTPKPATMVPAIKPTKPFKDAIADMPLSS
jgi:DNA-binding protein HU-beta